MSKWIIDVCVPELVDQELRVRMHSWVVDCASPMDAIQTFVDHGSEEPYYTGDAVEKIIVGLQPYPEDESD